MPFLHGPIVAPASVPPTAWTAAFGPRRAALVLAPSSAEGWFGGLELVACDPVLTPLNPGGLVSPPYRASATLDWAGAALERSLASDRAALTAVLLRYDGSGWSAEFPRGLARSPRGWHAWGDWSGRSLPTPLPTAAPAGLPLMRHVVSSLGREGFCVAVEAAREAMRAGELYVVNVCRRLTGEPATDAAGTFAALLGRTAAPMAAFWDLPGRALLSASPERFLRLTHGLLTVHPVKGTRPRGAGPAEDERLLRELRACPKERAEHTMVVDLERNDLGRVCEPGSVVVAPMLHAETTAYCHQLVSSVGGILRAGCPLGDVLAATFPCGSVTGAPKPSAMRHIARLEPGGRGEHTGSLIVAIPGRLDSSVLIRTAVMTARRIAYGVGCGITVDSDAEAEWEETETKAWPVLGDLG